MTIWDRFISKEFLRTFFFSLFSFYFLFILIDYANHSDRFTHVHGFFTYYFCEWMVLFGTIAPFALLISSIKVVSKLMLTQELIAMMASGVQVHRLLRPMILLTLIIIAFLYLNFEFITPRALLNLHRLDVKRQKSSPSLHQIVLKDGSSLIFSKCDQEKELLHNVYWIRSLEDIYHMKTVSYQNNLPVGTYVDHFRRNSKGELAPVESHKQQTFLTMRLTKKRLSDIITPPDEQALSKLWKKFPKNKHIYTDLEADVLASFYQKLALPWACLLAVIGPIPFCLNFTRKPPLFLIYACSIFTLVALVILLNSAYLLGKRQVMDPFLVTAIPFFLVFCYFGVRYRKIV